MSEDRLHALEIAVASLMMRVVALEGRTVGLMRFGPPPEPIAVPEMTEEQLEAIRRVAAEILGDYESRRHEEGIA